MSADRRFEGVSVRAIKCEKCGARTNVAMSWTEVNGPVLWHFYEQHQTHGVTILCANAPGRLADEWPAFPVAGLTMPRLVALLARLVETAKP